MSGLDWAIVAAYCLFTLGLGLWAQRRDAGRDTESYFISRRDLPWWIAGASMAASAFSVDTPLYVANLTRSKGVSGNWEWWYYGISGVLGATVMARIWRRAGIMTDLELITLRYSGRAAHVLRGFRALFFGLLFNPLGMAGVIVAVLKLIAVVDPSLADAQGWPTGNGVWFAGGVVLVAVTYSVLSGFAGVVLTDLAQFVISIVGASIMAIVAVSRVGGLDALVAHPEVASRVGFLPDLTWTGWDGPAAGFATFLGVSWWTYVNADGGGKNVQRMASCKDEVHAERATWLAWLTFVALRSWPWILVALAGLVLLPDAPDPERVYPQLMMELGSGLRGVVFASLIAAFMSTIDTQLNWGASYLVNDLIRPYLAPGRSERFYVACARLCAVPTLLVVLGFFVLRGHGEPSKAITVTEFLRGVIVVSSGLGAVYLLRWFWWRLTAWGEIAAMTAAPLTAWLIKTQTLTDLLGREAPLGFAPSTLVVTGATLTAAALVSFVGPRQDHETLLTFAARVRPPGFWGPFRVLEGAGAPTGRWLLVRFVAGNAVLFGAAFTLGGLLLRREWSVVLGNVALLGAGLLVDRWARGRLARAASSGDGAPGADLDPAEA